MSDLGLRDAGPLEAPRRRWALPALSPVARKAARRLGAERVGIALHRSVVARRIIGLNIVAILMLVVGILVLTPHRASLVAQREQAMVTQSLLAAALIATGATGSSFTAETAPGALSRLPLEPGVAAFILTRDGRILAEMTPLPAARQEGGDGRSTLMTSVLARVWAMASAPRPDPSDAAQGQDTSDLLGRLAPDAIRAGTVVRSWRDGAGATIFSVATPIARDGRLLGVLALTSAAGEIDHLVWREREAVLQIFVLASLVSIGLGIVLASTIATPLSELAAAAAGGGPGQSSGTRRVRIPDFSSRSDEIGGLSTALRRMVGALYDRIDANEQFAADVAHEIKNPLASLRSAAGTLRLIDRPEQRKTLLDVIDHDVRRLDRLVSDIANASRLDSELVREEEAPVDLVAMAAALGEHLARGAAERGIDLSTDLPDQPVIVRGLENRLAQVVVNLVANAISFCEEGDAIRLWVRRRDDHAVVVVEDTGPGIPPSALRRIFERFYSERPTAYFGSNSGLGLSISRQIVEAHGGVIWAENICPTAFDAASDPLGARFVMRLPL